MSVDALRLEIVKGDIDGPFRIVLDLHSVTSNARQLIRPNSM